jgi:hypothetical protein
MCGPRKEEVTRRLRKYRNAKLDNFRASPDVARTILSRSIRYMRLVARTGEMISACKFFVGKAEGKTSDT